MLPTLCWGEYKLIPSCCAQLNTGSDILEDKTNRMPEKIIYINDFYLLLWIQDESIVTFLLYASPERSKI